MDLGFGESNQHVGDATAAALMVTAAAQEEALEREISQYDALLDDDEALQALRAKRLDQMKKDAMDRKKWIQLGHGSYTELANTQQHGGDVAKAFFNASRESERLVVHFYRPSTEYCDVFHKHLTKLAANHLETRFCKINVENCDTDAGSGASFLVERLGVVVMPTLVLIENRKAVHHIRGFDELGGTDNFSMRTLARVLTVHGAIRTNECDYDTDDDDDNADDLGLRSGVNSIRISKRNRCFDDDEC